jgi:hypothetical protein
MNTINRITNKLDYYGTGIEWGTTEDVKVNLWTDLDNLRNYNNRNNLINNWKYKDVFENAKFFHAASLKTDWNKKHDRVGQIGDQIFYK